MAISLPNQKFSKQTLSVLITVFLACFIDGFDGSILNTALPFIAQAFDADVGTVSWLSLAYLLTVAGTILIFGKFASYGFLKKLFVSGSVLFVIGLLICLAAFSFPMLIAGRVVQGAGAAMLLSCASVICVRCLPEEGRGLGFGIVTVGTFIGIALGPVLGGFLLSSGSLKLIFLANLPLAILCVISALLLLPKDIVDKERKKFDIFGALLLFASMILGVYVLDTLPKASISDFTVLIPVLLFAVCFILFIAVSLKKKEPFFNLRIFKIKAVTLTLLASVILQIVFGGMLYLLPFYITNQFHADSVLCGSLLLIEPAVTAVLGGLFGYLSDTHGKRIFCILGSILLIVLYVWFALLNPAWGLIPFICMLAFSGVCYSMINGPMSGRLVDVTPKSEQETTATIAVSCMYLSSVLGTAVFSALFTAFTSTDGAVVSFGSLSEEVFRLGFAETMLVGMLCMILVTFLFFVIKEIRMKKAE